jgi:threonine aldolase
MRGRLHRVWTAALFAIEHMVERLADDHANAHVLAEGLSTVRGPAVDAAVRTNT